MKYLMYHRPFGLSAKRLAASLGISTTRTGRGQVVVAWGAPNAPETALNGGIRVGKLHQLQTWKSADLSTLEYSSTPRTGWLPRSGNSFGGRDFLTNPPNPPAYWTKPVTNVIAEWRVHLVRKSSSRGCLPQNYKVIRLGRKVNSDPSLNVERNGVQIRSRQFGWHLQYFGSSMSRTLTSLGDLSLQCRWAIATLGWDFGAIDVLQTDQGFVLLEANSAPSLRDDNTLKAYADAIKEIIGD